MSLVKFISGDGVEHEVEETSLAADVMRNNGFQQVGGEPEEENTEVDLAKLNRDALIAKAAELGITIDAADKSQTKKVIIAAIEEAQSAAAEGSQEPETETSDKDPAGKTNE